MRWVTIVCAVLLVVDLLIGSAIIVWKCAYSGNSLECQIATGGTLGSLCAWLLLLLACPLCMIRCQYVEMMEKSSDRLKNVLHKLRPHRSRQVYIQSEIYLPTTLAMRGPRDKVAFDVNIMTSQGAAHPLMSPKMEDVVAIPAVVYTFNETNQHDTGSSPETTTTCVEADDP